MAFFLFILFIIILRISELVHSRNNERWLLLNGAVEYGKKHYPFIVALHVLFIVSMIMEYSLFLPTSYSVFFLVLYFILLILKIWILQSLGKFWNTKIYHIPNVALVKKGLYRYLKHPNYMIVIAELAVIPMVFNLIYTSIIFTLLNGIMLYVRIKEENKVLAI